VSKTIAKGQPYNLWRCLLNTYAALKFTFDSDRLPTLYGLAQAMQGLGLGIYCAGLWTDRLPEGLSWYCSKASVARKGRGPYPYQAPTWSWVSIRGRVSHYDNIDAYQPSVKILEPYPNSAANDFGSAKSGPLKVSGRSISAVLCMSRAKMTGEPVGIRWLRSPDHDATEGLDSWMGFYPDDLASATPQEGEEVAVWCLLIGIWTPSRKSEVAIRPIHYVLVLKASGRVSGAYERIGLTTGWEQWSLHSQEKDFDIG
jgi:hypothetical protein